MTTTPTLTTIRARFLAEVEHAAQEMEQQLQGPVLDSLAYRQGQRDKLAQIVAHLTTWRDSIPNDRSLAPTRNALPTILHAIQR